MDKSSAIFRSLSPAGEPGLEKEDVTWGMDQPSLEGDIHSQNHGPDRPRPELQEMTMENYDASVGDFAKELARQIELSKKKVGDVVVVPAPERAASGDKMSQSIYARIVASLKRLAEGEPSAEPQAPAEGAVEPQIPEVTIPAGSLGSEVDAEVEARKEKVRKDAEEKRKKLKELLEQYRSSEGPSLPPGTKKLEIKEGDPEYAEAVSAKDEELDAIEELLMAIGKYTVHIINDLHAKAMKAQSLEKAYRTKESYGRLRSLWMSSAKVKERYLAALKSKEAIEAGIQSLKISPSLRAVIVDEKKKTAPGKVYWHNIDEVIALLEKMTATEERLADPNISPEEKAQLTSELETLSEQADQQVVARGRTGIPSEAKEVYKSKRGVFPQVVDFLKKMNDLLAKHFETTSKSAGALSSFPLAHERAAQFQTMLSAIERNMKDAEVRFKEVSGEGQVLMKPEMDKIQQDLKATSERLASVRLLYAASSEKSALIESVYRMTRKAMDPQASAADVQKQLQDINADIDNLLMESFPPESIEKGLEALLSEADGTASVLEGTAEAIEEIPSIVESGDEGMLSKLWSAVKEFFTAPPQQAPALAGAAAGSREEQIRMAISAGLARSAAEPKSPFRQYWESMRGVTPGLSPKDISDKEQLSQEDEKKLKLEVEKGMKKVDDEEKRLLDAISQSKTKIGILKERLSEMAGVTEGMASTLDELTNVRKYLGREYEKLAALAEEKYKTAQTAVSRQEAGEDVLIKWQNLMAATQRSKEIAEAAAAARGISNAKSLFMIIGETYGALIKLGDEDMFSIVEKASKNFTRFRMMEYVLSNLTKWAQDKKGGVKPTGLAMEVEGGPDLVLNSKEAVTTLNELLKSLTTTIKKLQGIDAVSIRSTPVRKKKMEGGNVTETSSADPRYEEKAKTMMDPGEAAFPEGEAQAASTTGIERVAEGADPVDEAVSVLQSIDGFLTSIDAQVEDLSNFYIENNQGLKMFNQMLGASDVEDAEGEGVPEGAMSAVPASQNGDLNRTAGEYDKFDVSQNKLEIVEGEKGKKVLVINKGLKNLVSKRVREMMQGGYKCGDQVQVDFSDHLGVGTVKAYIGNGVYRIEVEGSVMEVPAKNVLGLDTPWR